MKQESPFDKMDLPAANHNEDLETISELKLRPLFDTGRFHFCTQDRRDKGIDVTYELKRSNKHIGFRFIIQLKATESVVSNNDGSYSLSVATSNINYLLNHSVPAFYIFYVLEKNEFFYCALNELLKSLQEKDNDWGEQKTHTIRFEQKLDQDALTAIYDQAMKQGLMQRTLKERSAFIASSIHSQERITIDSDSNIHDDAKIRELVERAGIALINEGRWREVLQLHQNATGHLKRSAAYNMTIGVAHYYGGSRLDALSFFKAASKDKAELDQETQKYLQYFDATVRFSMGLIQEDAYNAVVRILEKSKSLGLYILLEKAKKQYMRSFDTDAGENFDAYKATVEALMQRQDAHENFILTARCELALFEGFNVNSDYLKGVGEINAFDEALGPDAGMRVAYAKKMINANSQWSKSLEDIIAQAQAAPNSFIYFTALLNYVKVAYQFDVFSRYFRVVKELPGYPIPEPKDNPEKLELWQKRIGLAANFFSQIGHVENTITASAAFFELLHYVGKFDLCNKIMPELEQLAENYELTEEKKKLELLKNGGTTHEKFKEWVDTVDQQIRSVEQEQDQLKKQMMDMDTQEKEAASKIKEPAFQIELFPIGRFQFPSEKLAIVYEIVGITKEAEPAFDSAFKMFIPVANILRHPVTQEGFMNGNADNSGIPSLRNIFRIRKAFHENRFYRISTN